MQTVILLEDESIIVTLLKNILSSEYRVISETSLAAGLGVLERESKRGVALLFIDLCLPDSDGLDTLRAVLAESGNIPVIVGTGHADDVLERECFKLGAVDFIVKPYDVLKLSRRLRRDIYRGDYLRNERERRRLAEEKTERLEKRQRFSKAQWVTIIVAILALLGGVFAFLSELIKVKQ